MIEEDLNFGLLISFDEGAESKVSVRGLLCRLASKITGSLVFFVPDSDCGHLTEEEVLKTDLGLFGSKILNFDRSSNFCIFEQGFCRLAKK
jgi:hypothetical protein